MIRKFKIACVEYAVASARKVQPIPLPDYWQPIEDSCRQVINALNDIGDLTAARAGAGAYAAAAGAAAGAYAAIHAARAAAYDANAVDAARAAAHADLFEIFINIILSEYENKG